MRRGIRGVLVFAVVLATLPASAFAWCNVSTCAPDGQQASGAVYRVCMPEPSCWNNELVVFAHGYVDAGQPVGIPEDQLVIDGVSLPALTNALGFAFAVTSYSRNGLAVREGVADVTDLVDVFGGLHGPPGRVYLVGPSEGGQVTAMAVEQRPDVFSGGLSTCGPIGQFKAQVHYLGDFRVVFDYFFPGVIPGPAIEVPESVINDWAKVYVPAIQAALAANPFARDQLLAVTRAPFDPAVPATREATVLGLLWYNVFATNDATARLGGHPYDNRTRWYTGSTNDLFLNIFVRRYAPDASAVAEMAAHYETTGVLTRPLVTMHTTGDPIVPYGHEILYRWKTLASGSAGLHDNLPVFRYGHCAFTAVEVLVGFVDLLVKVQGAPLTEAQNDLGDEAARTKLLEQVRQRPVAH